MKTIIYLYLFLFSILGFSQKEKPKTVEELQTKSKFLLEDGNKLYDKGDYANAANKYQEALKLNPNYDKAKYNLGDALYQQNKAKEASELYAETTKLTEDNFVKADAFHNLGNIAMKNKKYAEAVEAYKNSLRNNPKDDETRYNLALAQKLLKKQQQKNKNKKKDKNKDKNKDNKDKKKDKKDKGDKDKDKKGDQKEKNKDKGDKDKNNEQKDGKGDKDKNQDKNGQQPKPQPSKLSPQQVKQLLQAMNNEENKTQKKMNARKERGRKVKQDKDW